MEHTDRYPGASVVRPRGGGNVLPPLFSFVTLCVITLGLWQPDLASLFQTTQEACVQAFNAVR